MLPICVTDWLPIVGVAMAGVFTTMALAGRALQATTTGASLDLRTTRLAFWITVALTAGLYGLYLVFDESWLWYA
ncbi:MAG: hypothetical protein KY455_03005 [Euryarchaeota archaeon]|nr:hypothetical protein [Euryarchaeota archaeon]